MKPTLEDTVENGGPILRLFEVRARDGRAHTLIEKFSTTSAAVVRDEPGNAGYFYGRVVESEGNVVIFASLWSSLAAVKARFGDAWESSFLPPGYEDLVDECSVRHFDLSGGWHVTGLARSAQVGSVSTLRPAPNSSSTDSTSARLSIRSTSIMDPSPQPGGARRPDDPASPPPPQGRRVRLASLHAAA